MVAQVELRQQANALAERLDAAGWTVTATPAEATRSFFGRLIGGAESVGDNEDATDSVASYVAATDLATVENDLEAVVAETRALADQTLIVASADGNIDSGDLARDLAAVERALGAVRRANGFFDAVRQSETWAEADAASLAARVEGFEAVEARLASAADALAERRWASRSGLFG